MKFLICLMQKNKSIIQSHPKLWKNQAYSIVGTYSIPLHLKLTVQKLGNVCIFIATPYL